MNKFDVPGPIISALEELGYLGLLEWEWAPSIDIDSSTRAQPIPVTAFWGHPYDQFHSALAVVTRNGVPDVDLARQTASQAWCHVLVCGERDASLWRAGRGGVTSIFERISIDYAANALIGNSSILKREEVANEKLRIRQYALFESDPAESAFQDWAFVPTDQQLGRLLSRVISAVTGRARTFEVKGEGNSIVPKEAVRWALRITALRIGRDRLWTMARGLNRTDIGPYVKAASVYPSRWRPAAPLNEADYHNLTGLVLENLHTADFSTIDPAIVVRALNAPGLGPIRKPMNLYPTPGPIVWQLVSLLPLSPEMGIADPTTGTGTFLVAAGHVLWNLTGSTSDIRSLLQPLLLASDQEDLPADVTRLSLDFAFGAEGSPWQVSTQQASASLKKFESRQGWAILGNLPWSGKGRSHNEATLIFEDYLKFLQDVPNGWIATITPRSMWTARSNLAKSLRSRIAQSFDVEHIWELNWNIVPGGRSEAVASILTTSEAKEGQSPRPITVWRRTTPQGAAQTIGYSRTWSQQDADPVFLGPYGCYFSDRMATFPRLSAIFNVRVGLQPKKTDELTQFIPQGGGAIPFVLATGNRGVRFKQGGPSYGTVEKPLWLPRNLLLDKEAVKAVFLRPQEMYRLEMGNLPQIAIPEQVFEGVHRLRVFLVNEQTAFSNRFLIFTPLPGAEPVHIEGVARILNSVFGRLWIHHFGSAGQHVSREELLKFPLPPSTLSEAWERNHYLNKSGY